jgi:hypothetical protein
MKITSTAALKFAPTGEARFGFDLGLSGAEVAALLHQKPGTLREVCTALIRGAFEEVLAKDAKERETQAKLVNGEIAANEDPDGVPSVGGNTGRTASIPSTTVVSPAQDPADMPGEAGARIEGAAEPIRDLMAALKASLAKAGSA